MALIIIVVLMIGVFALLMANTDPCTTQITGCIANKVLGNGVMVDANLVHFALFCLLVGAMYQLYRSR
jgi:hypothetical protein